MSVTERDKLIRLEGEVERLKADAAERERNQHAVNRELHQALYGNGPNDKNAVFAQLMSLQNDRAIRIWFVSIFAGIGASVAAAIISGLFPHS